MSNLAVATDETFNDILEAPLVLVDFWAPWCQGCIQLKPIIQRLADEVGDRVLVVAVNVDEAPEAAKAYNVSSIPDLIFLRDGEEVHRAGPMPFARLRREIQDHLGV